jgi:hypothetical protein
MPSSTKTPALSFTGATHRPGAGSGRQLLDPTREYPIQEKIDGGGTLEGMHAEPSAPAGTPTQPADLTWLLHRAAQRTNCSKHSAPQSKAFKDEDEVRLLVLHNPETGVWGQLKFREGIMGLTPYVELSLNDPGLDRISAIREIVVGPQPNQAEAIRAAKLLVERHGLDVEVHPSDIPLRS